MAEYIHQLDDWPDFRWDPGRLAGRLGAVSRLQGHLLGRMERIGFSPRAEASLRNLTEEILKSNEIEGEKLDRKQVRSSIARRLGVEIGALTPADRNVEGVVEMMLDATQKFYQPLTKERLFGWHAALFPTGRSGMRRITVGAWRSGIGEPMQIVSGPICRERIHYEAPFATRVDAEMRAFLHWFNGTEDLDLLLKAGVAHFWFVTIHPFEDGNGRIARALTDLLLARSEQSPQRFYSMSVQIREARNEYYRLLETMQRGDLDITPWMEWFLDQLVHAFKRAEAELATVVVKAQFWDQHRTSTLNDRQHKMLNMLIDGFEGTLTSSKWAKITKCSPDTALRDIDGLIAQNILKKDAAGGRSTSYSLVEPS